MERNEITPSFPWPVAFHNFGRLFSTLFVAWFFAGAVFAGDGSTYVGSINCSDSSCHGGGGTTRSEFTRWSKFDFHHERPFATLTTARAARMAENLKISDPTADARCTSCHAPLQTVPTALLGHDNKTSEGVSCENCHAPASNWIRSHTRLDWTTADRVQAGMRDLKNLYVRANTCVACHQNVDPDTRRAGHPELIFELDGQLANQPRHWDKAADKPGPQIWLVGQATALREISWQLLTATNLSQELRDQDLRDCEGLLRVLQPICKLDSHLPPFDAGFLDANHWSGVQHWSDDLAKAAANLAWPDSLSRQCLNALAAAGAPFADKTISAPVQARYAQRLVLGLDRLVTGLAPLYADAKLNQSVNHLFGDVQSLPDFAAGTFAADLNQFQRDLEKSGN
ncbi:MAG TPA: multiheme c-type cytochrome [Verrucomicrobiae bacterium]